MPNDPTCEVSARPPQPVLALPAPPTPPGRPLAHRIVFDLAGPGTWQEWDACLYYRLDLKLMIRRVESVLALYGREGGADRA